MKVMQGSDPSFENRSDKRAGRGGSGHKSRVLLNDKVLGRDPNRSDNFYVGISSVEEGEFSTPRHHHNFDQWRYMIEGCADFTTGKLTAGMLGYFPEGAYYGPQENVVGTVIIAQFGGPSGSGYVSRDQIVQAHAEIKALNIGVFEDGMFRRTAGGDGEKIQDAYEVQWEHVRKRPLDYPKPQYADPILIDTNAYPWMPVAGTAGVYEKALGTFTSCQFRAARFKLDPNSTFSAKGRGVYIVLSGNGSVENEPFRQYTTLYLEDGEQGIFTADEVSDILLLGLPSMDLMQRPVSIMQAAE